jgi:hypothetical protein
MCGIKPKENCSNINLDQTVLTMKQILTPKEPDFVLNNIMEDPDPIGCTTRMSATTDS